jgi:Recombination endonuclease VII
MEGEKVAPGSRLRGEFSGNPWLREDRRKKYLAGSIKKPWDYPSTMRAQRDAKRRKRARLAGYAPPPSEKDCRPRPLDDRCECYGELAKRFHLDHCHDTGVFRGWVCTGCNTGTGLPDSIEKLEKRILFLKRARS